MFVTCHITFCQLSNFVGASLEERTIRNNKLHFTWGASILLLKKKKEKGPESGFLFFQLFWHFLKHCNSNHNLGVPSYSLFSKCFRGFSILVCIGVQVFFRCFLYLHSSSRAWLTLALASYLPPFDRKTLKNCACSADPGFLNETKGSWFPLSCLSSHHDGW